MAVNAAFIPTLTGIVKQALITKVPRLGLYSIGHTAKPSVEGESCLVNLYGNPGASALLDKVNNHYGTGSAPDLDQVTVTFGKPRKITKVVTAEHIKKGVELKKLVDGMVARILLDVAIDGASLITAANFPTVAHTGVASTLTADVMATLSVVNAAAAGWDPSSLKAVLASTYYANLLQDDDLKSSSPEDQKMRAEGIVRTLSGWTSFNFSGLPGNAENLTGFITDGSALALAFAPVQPAPGVEQALAMFETVEVDGVVFTIRGHANLNTDEFLLTVEALSGKAKGRTDGLQRIRSAAP